MIILLGFEESQAVTCAFRARGHVAFSCDLKPCSGGHPEWHLQMDIYQAMRLRPWDFIGLHPPCTKLAWSGNRWYSKTKPRHAERLESLEWTIEVWEEARRLAAMGYMENPLGMLNSDARLPKPQIIQPWQYGHGERKTTCLWTWNLPPLLSFQFEYERKDRIHQGCGFAWSSYECKTERSKTYTGIAAAMARQWG